MKESWILKEKFNALNVTGDQERNDTRFIEDVVWNLPSTQNEAYKKYVGILASLSIATQEKLWNPKSTLEDLQFRINKQFKQKQYYEKDNKFYIGNKIT